MEHTVIGHDARCSLLVVTEDLSQVFLGHYRESLRRAAIGTDSGQSGGKRGGWCLLAVDPSMGDEGRRKGRLSERPRFWRAEAYPE